MNTDFYYILIILMICGWFSGIAKTSKYKNHNENYNSSNMLDFLLNNK